MYFAFAQQRLTADRIASLVHTARDTLVAARNRQKQYADAKRMHLVFDRHDKVMLKTKFLNLRNWPSKKLFPLWLGPFKVEKVVSNVAYRLVLPEFWKVHDVFHVSLLKPYRDNGQQHAPNPFTYLAGRDNEYEVECVLDHRPHSIAVAKGLPNRTLQKLEFLVRWANSGPMHDTWEPYNNMKHAPEALAAYGFSLKS